MVKVRLGLTTRERILWQLTEYNKLQPPQGSNAHSTLHMDTIIVCRSNARGQTPTPDTFFADTFFKDFLMAPLVWVS